MGAGTGHIGWRYHMTLTKSFRGFENTHTVRSTVTEREAREGILWDIAGEWNERSPLVIIITVQLSSRKEKRDLHTIHRELWCNTRCWSRALPQKLLFIRKMGKELFSGYWLGTSKSPSLYSQIGKFVSTGIENKMVVKHYRGWISFASTWSMLNIVRILIINSLVLKIVI